MNDEQEIVIKASLVTYKYNNGFTLLVYENLCDEISNFNKYIWVAIPPNWKDVNLMVGEPVLLRYFSVKAGDSYYDSKLDVYKKYKTSINWFKDAIHLNYITNKSVILDA